MLEERPCVTVNTLQEEGEDKQEVSNCGIEALLKSISIHDSPDFTFSSV